MIQFRIKSQERVSHAARKAQKARSRRRNDWMPRFAAANSKKNPARTLRRIQRASERGY